MRWALEWRRTASASGSSVSRTVSNWIRSPSASGNRRSRTAPFERTSTACSASFGPIARAASSPVAPSGSSSSELSGRTTFMSTQDTEPPREDDRNEELEQSPVPDHEDEGPEQEQPQRVRQAGRSGHEPDRERRERRDRTSDACQRHRRPAETRQ